MPPAPRISPTVRLNVRLGAVTRDIPSQVALVFPAARTPRRLRIAQASVNTPAQVPAPEAVPPITAVAALVNAVAIRHVPAEVV